MTNKPTITQADRDAVIIKAAYDIALSHSNYGDGEGNKRAFAIAADLKKKLPPTNTTSTTVAELQAEVARLREALEYYAENDHYDHGDVPGHIYVIYDHGRTARAALAQKEPVG